MPNQAIDLVRRAPVTTLSTAEALTAALLTFLVTHNVIGNVDVSTTTQTIAPFVALALPAIFGAAKWALVSPYEKVKHWAEQEGVVSDADFARLEALMDAKFQELSDEATVAGEELSAPSDPSDPTDPNAPSEDDAPVEHGDEAPPGMGAGGLAA